MGTTDGDAADSNLTELEFTLRLQLAHPTSDKHSGRPTRALPIRADL